MHVISTDHEPGHGHYEAGLRGLRCGKKSNKYRVLYEKRYVFLMVSSLWELRYGKDFVGYTSDSNLGTFFCSLNDGNQNHIFQSHSHAKSSANAMVDKTSDAARKIKN